MKLSKKQLILRGLLLILLSFSIGFGAYSCNAKRIAGNSLPMPFGIGMATVLSGSMEPDISVDDVVIVKSCKDYNVGEVVVFDDGSSYTVHEIIKKDGETFRTKGKANNTADPPIDISEIKGKVIFTLPKFGKIVDIIRSPIITFIIIGTAAYLLYLSYRKEKEQDEKEIDKIKAEIERLKKEKDLGK